MQFVFRVHNVAVKLNYSTCKRDVSRAVGIPSSGDSGHQCTESPLHEIWWGFRPVGIPSSGDSVQWGFRVHTIANYYNFTNKTQGYRANHVANHCNFPYKTQGYRANHVANNCTLQTKHRVI